MGQLYFKNKDEGKLMEKEVRFVVITSGEWGRRSWRIVVKRYKLAVTVSLMKPIVGERKKEEITEGQHKHLLSRWDICPGCPLFSTCNF